jgi:GTPase SAR1 family protein
MPFGQLVIGPPGSGKTTYCAAMRAHLTARGRNVAIVNLDPANDAPPYEVDVDVAKLVTVADVSAEYELGPNGGLVYCIEYLAANLDWLVEQLRPLHGRYILFDCPGQIELYTHHEAVRSLTDGLASALDFRLVAVHLLDSHHCAEVSKYVSGLVVSLSAMLQLELPHINVLSKVDIVESSGPLSLPLSYYTDCSELERLLPFCEASPAFSRKHAALTSRLCELVEDFGLVRYLPCCASDPDTLERVLAAADKACGFAFGALERNNHGLFATSAGTLGHDYDRVAAVADRYARGQSDEPLDGSDPDALARRYSEGLLDDDEEGGGEEEGGSGGGGDMGLGEGEYGGHGRFELDEYDLDGGEGGPYGHGQQGQGLMGPIVERGGEGDGADDEGDPGEFADARPLGGARRR